MNIDGELLQASMSPCRARLWRQRGAKFGAIVAAFLLADDISAQSLRVVERNDSALVIATLPSCAAPCADSARVQWRYGPQFVTRVLRGRSSDTLRVERLSAQSAYVDSVRLTYVPLGNPQRSANVAAFVAPIATTAAPDVAPSSSNAVGSRAPQTTANAAGTSTAGGTTSPARSTAPANAGSSSTSPSNTPPSEPPPTQPGKYAEAARPATFSIAYPVISGKSIRVGAGGDLQKALNDAQPGDEIVLANGAKFFGNYVLPAKRGTEWIVVRGDAKLPIAGTRIDAGTLAMAAQIVTPNSEPAILTAAGAARWRLTGFQISHAEGAKYNYGIVVLGRGDENAVAAMPTDIVLDRMFIHGSPNDGASRCIAFNGARLAVVDSWITECHAKGFDSQGVCGWNGPGPFLIQNNRIEASGQGVMFGGADPRVRDVLPSDIVIRRNYIFKPMSWARGRWTVKAAFELKNGKRVLFEGNVIENHWADAQSGFAMLFQTLADNNTSWAWTTVQDVLVQNNIVRNSTSGINILARVAYNGGTLPTNPTSRVIVVNNRWENVGIDPVNKSGGMALQLLNDLRDVTFARNTFTLPAGQMQKAISFDGKPQTRTTIADNVFPASTYGVTGNATGAGTATVNAFMPGGQFRGNVLPGINAAIYPAGGVTTRPMGADVVAINVATAGVVR